MTEFGKSEKNADTRRVATICMRSSEDKIANITKALDYVARAAAQGADWVLLPEVFPYIGPYENLYAMAEPEDGPLVRQLADAAKTHRITLFAGTVHERAGRQTTPSSKGLTKVYNTFYIFDSTGSRIGKYRKIHLFGLKADNNTAICYEDDGFLAGNRPLVIEHEGWKIGCGICYDLRFPELFGHMAEGRPLDAIILPSAFTKITGEHHWLLLLKARAVEHLAYMVASNQTGQNYRGMETFGHSAIIDPWGQVLADTGVEEGIAFAELSKIEIAKFRSRLPALTHKRPDIYRRSL